MNKLLHKPEPLTDLELRDKLSLYDEDDLWVLLGDYMDKGDIVEALIEGAGRVDLLKFMGEVYE